MQLDTCWRRSRAWWLWAVCLPLTLHASTVEDYANRHPLLTDGNSAVWRVELSPAVYAVSAPHHHLRDLVVVNAQGQQVPFGPLPPEPERSHAFSLNTTLLPLPGKSSGRDDAVRIQRSSDGGILIKQPSTVTHTDAPAQWLLDAGRPVSLERIEIDPAALPEDASFHIAVQASNDLQQWSSADQTSEIVSVRRGAGALAQRAIAVSSDTPSRYYRLTLRPGDKAPWDSAQTPAVTLYGNAVEPQGGPAAALRWLDVSIPSISAAPNGGTRYDYVLPAALPLEAARITLAGSNTVANYRLLDTDDNAERVLASGTAVQIGNEPQEAVPTSFARTRVHHLRLQTDTPLAQAPTLSVAWRPDVFIFLAEGNGPYSLLAGSHAARRAEYPLQAALDRIRPADANGQWQPPLATLGAASKAGGPAALLAPAPGFDWTRPLLWLVLIGGALAVVAMAWSLLRQTHRGDDKA